MLCQDDCYYYYINFVVHVLVVSGAIGLYHSNLNAASCLQTSLNSSANRMDEILANINKKLEEIDRKKVSIGIEEEVKGGADPRTEVPDPMADFVDEDERETNNGRYSPTKSAAPRRRGSTTEVRTQCFVKIGLLSLIYWWD